MTLSWVAVDELLDGVREGRLADGPTAQAVLAYRVFAPGRRRPLDLLTGTHTP